MSPPYLCGPNCGVPIVSAHEPGFCAHGSTGFAPPPLQCPLPQSAATAPPGTRIPSAYFQALFFFLARVVAVSALARTFRCAIERFTASLPALAETRTSHSPGKIFGVIGGATAYPLVSLLTVADVYAPANTAPGVNPEAGSANFTGTLTTG